MVEVGRVANPVSRFFPSLVNLSHAILLLLEISATRPFFLTSCLSFPYTEGS